MTSQEFKSIYLPLDTKLYRVAFYILESEDDAKDAVQDLYVKLWNSRDMLDTVLNPQAYAQSALRNICIDKIRSAEVRNAESVEEKYDLADSADIDKEIIDKEKLKMAMTLIDALPEKQREVIYLRIFEEMEYDEIAERTGLSQTNLRVLLCMARQTIKRKISV